MGWFKIKIVVSKCENIICIYAPVINKYIFGRPCFSKIQQCNESLCHCRTCKLTDRHFSIFTTKTKSVPTKLSSPVSKKAWASLMWALLWMAVFSDCVASSKLVTALILSPDSQSDSARSNTASLFAPLLNFTENLTHFASSLNWIDNLKCVAYTVYSHNSI